MVSAKSLEAIGKQYFQHGAGSKSRLPASDDLAKNGKCLQQIGNLSFFGLPGLDREHFRTAACKANPSKDRKPRLSKKKTAIPLPTDAQTVPLGMLYIGVGGRGSPPTG